MNAPEGVWVQGGGIEIPCFYQIDVKKGRKKYKNRTEGQAN